ncbi:Imm21 family immunity protein [Streptomyces albidoflavus]
MGGPLLVLPESAVRLWSGCTEGGEVLGDAGGRDDYDRACEVEGLAGVIPVGTESAGALVLSDLGGVPRRGRTGPGPVPLPAGRWRVRAAQRLDADPGVNVVWLTAEEG